ncbi:uncharacterized protein [Rutidosis leptorrhynchoides]|uniref:uncharacterized protein n=1 Tax=Rutidosis leptorrhynchoides TaxID=125765 RepID=UPI003A99BC1E
MAFNQRRINDTTNTSCPANDLQNNKRCKPSTNENEQQQNQPEPPIFEASRPNIEDVGPNYFERDPGKRKQIWEYLFGKREQVRRFYLNQGPFQIHLEKYPTKGTSTHARRFQYSWFSLFPNWLEYSPTRDAAYCFLCYLLCDKPVLRDTFIVKGFDKWKKVNDGDRCAFDKHIRSSQHKIALVFRDNLLQLALVAASREVIPVHQFFEKLTFLINVICASIKRHDELQKAKALETLRLLELDEIETGKGANQVGTLKRGGDTRWGSYFSSVCSLLSMFNATRVVLKGIIDDGSCSLQRGDADSAYCYTKSFEFVLILHLMKDIMGKTEILSQALQKKSQDIINAMKLVAATKESLNDLRNNGWDSLLAKVKIFCEKHEVDIPDLSALYKSGRYRRRQQDNQVSFEHYYRVDVFTSTLDKQLLELNNRFNDQAMELLTLSSTLVPRKKSKVLNIDHLCSLVEKYYLAYFTKQERTRGLVETEKHENYNVLDKLIRLILTLPVLTATTERAFSGMKLCKTRLRNKISDDFLADNLLVYIEREIAEKFDSDSIIDDFKMLKGRRAEL